MKIEKYEQLKAMPYGSIIWVVEMNDVRRYIVCCVYPSQAINSILITYGTNHSCSRWINDSAFNNGNIFTTYEEATDKLIRDMEQDLEAVKRIYKKQLTS